MTKQKRESLLNANQLLTSKSEMIMRYTREWELLYEYIGKGQLQDIHELLESLSEKALASLLTSKDLQGLTPLRKAVTLNKSEIAQILVSFGAEPSVTDPVGRTVLHIAAILGQRDLVAPLLVSKYSSVNVQDNNGWTPLHYAVRGKHYKVVDWLLFSGADVNIKNNDGVSPVEMLDAEAPVKSKMHSLQDQDLDINPVSLSSAFITRKAMTDAGADGKLMFVTTNLWPRQPQFILNIKMRPHIAKPPFPLRTDEYFFQDSYHYRMMRVLPQHKNRVKVYFRIFEEIVDEELLLKVSSKTKFLGEMAVRVIPYADDNTIQYLATSELDLKNEGQFVLIKRPRRRLLMPDQNGCLTCQAHPLIKVFCSQNDFPSPPSNWNDTRRDREMEDATRIMAEIIPMDASSNKKQEKNNSANAEEETAAVAENGTSNDEIIVEDDAEELVGGLKPGTMLDGDEEDTAEDFYYISYGWGLYLEVRQNLPLKLVQDEFSMEMSMHICHTPFYRFFHSSGKNPNKAITYQIMKTTEFQRKGTVFVLVREDSSVKDKEDPDPDDVPEEHFISDDGKNTNGQRWQMREQNRWSILSSQVANFKTRVVFQTNIVGTFIAVQINTGTDKYQLEDLDSSEEDTEHSDEEGDMLGDDEERGKMAQAESDKGEDGEGEEEREDASKAQESFVKKKAKRTLRTSRDGDLGESDSWDDDVEFSDYEPKSGVSRGMSVGGGPTPSTIKQSEAGGETSQQEEADDVISEKAENPDQNASNASWGDKNQNSRKKKLLSKRERNTNRNAASADSSRVLSLKDDFSDEELKEDLPMEMRKIVAGLKKVESSYPYLQNLTKDEVGEWEPPQKKSETGEIPMEDTYSVENLPKGKAPMTFTNLALSTNGIISSEKFKPSVLAGRASLTEDDYAGIIREVATLWRHRFHRETVICAHSRARPENKFDLVLTICTTNDLMTRAEQLWWSGYKMVSQSAPFPTKTSRYFTFSMEGSMIVEDPPGSTAGYIVTRSLFFYSSQTNSLRYVVKKAAQEKTGPAMAGTGGGKKGGSKKKDEAKSQDEPDAVIEVVGYPKGTQMDGTDVANITLNLNGPDLWNDKHVELRNPDHRLLKRLSYVLSKDRKVASIWWQIWLYLGFHEKNVEVEKVKPDWTVCTKEMFDRWFSENINVTDRGIVKVLSILQILNQDRAIDNVVKVLKAYKADLLMKTRHPRCLNLLVHWVMRSKITRSSLLSMIESGILKPVSEPFLVRLAEKLEPSMLFDIGRAMEVEENVLHAIDGEENILEPMYKIFRVLVKSRQKKDETIHYTLLLMEMVKALDQVEAKDFIVTETKKWMASMIETDPDTVAKLEKVVP